MSLVNFKKMMNDAMLGGYAVPHFNIQNLEWIKSILEVVKETNVPTIIGLTDAVSTYFGGYEVACDLVKSLIKNLKVETDVVMHLDHGSFDGCLKCIDAGFTSIMFDGSKLPLDENISKTKELLIKAHEKDMSVEAEVGGIGGTEDGITGYGEIADPTNCKKMADIGIDALACGIGNIHGKYPADWKGLNFSTLTLIKKEVPNMPLVLHGGSGIPADMIKEAIHGGIAKVNVSTELHLAFQGAIRKYIEDKRDLEGKGYDVRNMSKDGIEAIKDTVRTKMKLFGALRSDAKY